ncbi:MAG: transporter related protein [Chloroflexi bacterium]|jgi:multiple sugar transport system ATP-binding protein|nr:transporter related protein [Chloroflexota bacterium]
MAQVTVNKLIKRYGNVVAVNEISLQVRDHEFMVFLGPSGCGKTTTLRTIAGLETSQSGDIFIGERRVNDLAPGERDIAFVFQFYALYPHLSVFDNIAFPLRAQRTPHAEVVRRVHAAAATLQMEPLLNRRIRQLSSGEQQRVALGRAMVRQPQVFLMDEPLTNLDAQLRAETRAELKHIQHERGATTIYVTHDQVEAMAMGDRITVMHQGRIQQQGPPMEVYNRPANLFVAGFLGSPPMDIMPAQFSQNGTAALTIGPIRVPISDALRHAIVANGHTTDLAVGMRAEHVAVVPEGTEGAQPVTVFAVEHLGDENVVIVTLGNLRFRAKTGPQATIQEGDTLHVKLPSQRLHVFDTTTGDAIRSPM